MHKLRHIMHDMLKRIKRRLGPNADNSITRPGHRKRSDAGQLKKFYCRESQGSRSVTTKYQETFATNRTRDRI